MNIFNNPRKIAKLLKIILLKEFSLLSLLKCKLYTPLALTKCSSAVEYSKPFDKSDVESLNIVCISKLRINLK